MLQCQLIIRLQLLEPFQYLNKNFTAETARLCLPKLMTSECHNSQQQQQQHQQHQQEQQQHKKQRQQQQQQQQRLFIEQLF